MNWKVQATTVALAVVFGISVKWNLHQWQFWVVLVCFNLTLVLRDIVGETKLWSKQQIKR